MVDYDIYNSISLAIIFIVFEREIISLKILLESSATFLALVDKLQFDFKRRIIMNSTSIYA